IEFFA
uniref:Rubellidin-2.1 n=1 Tax=Litoria rubella TaxID=104895 RepID=RBE21_LITRU